MSDSITDRVLSRAKRVLEIGSEAADVLVHLQHGPSALGLAAVGMRVVNSVREHRAQTPDEYFAAWKPLELGALASQALASMRSDPEVSCVEVPSMHEGAPAVITTAADDVEIGWAISGSLKNPAVRVRKCWLRPSADVAPVLQRIGRALWTNMGTTTGVIVVHDDEDSEDLRFVAEDDEKILPSKRGRQLHERINKFKERGHYRSCFVIGESGIGKSCMLRYVSSLQGGFRLRFRLGKLGEVRPKALTRIVQILRPDILIIDDLDRYVTSDESYGEEEEKQTPEANAMLDPLEVFDKIVPLVLVSANFSEAITKALLRPGRFAEMIEMEDLDDSLYEAMLPDAPPKLIAALKRQKVPVVYLEELAKRVDALGYEEAAKEMKDLVERSDRILDLNQRRERARNRTRSPLVGKSPAQKAIMLEREGARMDLAAANSTKRAVSFRQKADRKRELAAQQRERATTAKTKKKATKKKASKKSKTEKTKQPSVELVQAPARRRPKKKTVMRRKAS